LALAEGDSGLTNTPNSCKERGGDLRNRRGMRQRAEKDRGVISHRLKKGGRRWNGEQGSRRKDKSVEVVVVVVVVTVAVVAATMIDAAATTLFRHT